MTKTKQALKGLCAMSLAVGIGAAALTALPNDADATVFTGDFTVTAQSSDPGLVINVGAFKNGVFTNSNMGKFTTKDILEGKTDTFKLFQIWTEETAVNPDDKNKKPISVTFTFTAPSMAGGTVEGETVGMTWGLTGFYHLGMVTWNSPLTLSYPYGGNGSLQIELSDGYFNEGGWWQLDEGKKNGAMVKATFTNVADPVPEPATLAVLGLGLAGLGLLRRRKQVV